MATAPRQNLFKQEELASDVDVEKEETQEQPAEQTPEQQPAEQPAEQPPEETAHQEAVPYDRFRAVNEQKSALEKELAEHREFRTRLDERQKIIEQANQQTALQQEQQRRLAERPDATIDPVGAELYDLRTQQALLIQNNQALQSQLQNFGQTYNNNQEQQVFSNWVTQEANTYHGTDPEYFNAAKYAADKRIGFWKQIAPNAPVGLAEKLVEGESILIARLAQQYGGQFAPTVAQLARDWGYGPAPAPAQRNGNGARAAAPRPATPQAQRLQQVQQGQRLQGLGAVPAGGQANGAAGYRNYSAADIANMPEREFMAAMANPQTAAELKYAMNRADGLEGEESY